MIQQISFEFSAEPFEELMNVLNRINQQTGDGNGDLFWWIDKRRLQFSH